MKKQHGYSECIACACDLTGAKLISFENMPASAQDIPNEEEMKNETGITLELFQCKNCGLVQFDCDAVSYYRDVIRAGGYSTTMVELRREQYKHLIETYGLTGKKFLEIGCGQGEFIGVLDEFEVEVYGIEHRNELVEMAKEKGLKVWKDFAYNAETPLSNPYNVDKYEVFLSFNFLEHQPNPKNMLDCIYQNLADDGMGLITVPSFEYILQQEVYYEFIRDHLAYYTFETLENLLNLSGFEVLEREMINRDTLSFIVKKVPKLKGDFISRDVRSVNVEDLQKNLEELNEEIDALIDRIKSENKKIAVWGASHQGFTLVATTNLKNGASYIIDSAPFKQGKYAPASHLPIVKPDFYYESPVDVIIVVAPGYTDEIANTIKTKFGNDIEILVLRSKHIEKYE